MTDDLDVVREIYNADPNQASSDLLDWTRTRLLLEAAAERAAKTDSREGHNPRRRLLAGGLAAAATAAAVVAVGALLPASHGGGPILAPSVAAAAVLDKVARTAAAQQPFSPPPAGEYMYTRTTETDLTMGSGLTATSPVYSYYSSTDTRQWRTAAGAGRTTIGYKVGRFLTAQDRTNWEADGRQGLGGQPSDQTYGPSQTRAAEYINPSGLPTDVARLVRTLEDRYGHSGGPEASGVLSEVTALLDQVGVRPTLRASLLDALGRVPGLQSYGTVVINRTRGEAIGLQYGGFRYMSVFEESTSRLLAQETILTSPSAATTTLSYKDVDLNQAVRGLTPGMLWYSIDYSRPSLVRSLHTT
jgi:hypothetical protein